MPKAQHPKAASFVRQSLFAGVTTFADFEARVTALAVKQARGDAFEVFAEAYLATQRKHDAANVWPLTAVPTQILQTLGLATKDYGVDGVFKTLLGNLNAYQVKFRTNRPALTWRELSTFMGLADSPQIRKSGTLQPERQRRLDEIGFDWRSESHKEEWATRFEQLKAYKERFGDSRVPVKWAENPQLGVWVTNQRHRLKGGTLSPEKEQVLREIGFE